MIALTSRQSAALFILEVAGAWAVVVAFLLCLAKVADRAEQQWQRAFRRHQAAQAALRRTWEHERAAMDLPPASAVLGRAEGLVSRPFDYERDGVR